MLYRLFGDINIVIIIELSNSLAFFITLFEYLRNLNNIDYIWDRIEGRDKTYFYKINRKNKLLEFVFSRLNEAELEYIDILLTEIEHNIPMQQIYIDKSNNCVTLEEDIHRNDEIFETAVTMIDVGRKIASIPVEQLIENLMKSEPFCLFKDVKGKLIKHFSV